MVSYIKTQCSKNNIKIILSNYHNEQYQKPNKQMPPLVAYHGPNTTFLVWNGVLGNTLSRFLRSFYQQSSHRPPTNPVTIWLWSLHQWCSIRHMLASKIPCRSYTSTNVSQIGLAASNEFSRNMCQSTKWIFKTI